MILVTGAGGKTGLAVLRALARNGQPTRALVRNVEQEVLVRETGATEIVIGDLLDEVTVFKAMTGLEAAYLICPNVHPKELEIAQNIISASRKAGVNRLIYHSVMYPQIEAMPHHWKKLLAEQELIQSGLEFTILQPAGYMQNTLSYWKKITLTGEYIIPYSTNSTFTPVDLEDVAEVVARVFASREHNGAIYSLAGPESLNSRQMAELMTIELGKEVSASTQSLADWEVGAKRRRITPYSLDALFKMFTYYDKHGFAGSSATLASLLHRSPTTFSQFLSRCTK